MQVHLLWCRAAVLHVERIGYSERVPTMVEHSWWPADMVPGLEQEETHIPDLFYAVVVEKYGIPEDAMPDAEEMGADVKVNVVPFAEIQKSLDESHHVLFF